MADFPSSIQTLIPGAQVLMLVQRGDVALYVVMNARG
jgi:hypothetical protein